jgi:chemotaxis protein histidine kinase CheA
MTTQAYFDDIQLHLIQELSSARRSISIAVAWFTDRELFKLVCQKASEGLEVELILMDDRINRGSSLDYEELNKAGGRAYLLGDKKRNQQIMHNKFCIIDLCTVITGSYNWSYQAQKNYENITVITDQPELAVQFQHEFELIKRRNFREDIPINFGKIFGHLDALKKFIQLEDDEAIRFSLGTLKKIVPPQGKEFAAVLYIIELVDKKDFEKALSKIVEYLELSTQIAPYADPEIGELKLELKSIEIQVAALEEVKSDIEKQLYSYNVRFNKELGELLKEILELRKEKLAKEVEADETKKEAYEEAKADQESFENQYAASEADRPFDLTVEQQQELKTKFRACSKMCHPDVVSEDQKKDAAAIFVRLNNAYRKNDLGAINEIYESLRKGIFSFSSETLKDIQKLYHQVVLIRERVTELSKKVRELKDSETYKTVSSIKDMDQHFNELYRSLEKERETLKVK